MAETCEHKYTFLRKETIDESGYRPGRDVYDIFFCEKCLTYLKVFVQHEEQSRERFGYEVTRKAY
jgi:hypothetical protein